MNTFSDNGRKPPFPVILSPLEGQNLANVAQKQIISEHSSNIKCVYTKFELDCLNTFSDAMVGNHFQTFCGH